MDKLPLYPYSFLEKKTTAGSKTNEFEQYVIDAWCTNRNEKIEYLLNLYRYGTYLYISDILPRLWENEPDCFTRFTSHEGYAVNMKKISITCLYIFFENVANRNNDAALVISGSYQAGEDKLKDSRKLKLYKYFFLPYLFELHLRLIGIEGMNAFVLIKKESALQNETIINDYKKFKSN